MDGLVHCSSGGDRDNMIYYSSERKNPPTLTSSEAGKKGRLDGKAVEVVSGIAGWVPAGCMDLQKCRRARDYSFPVARTSIKLHKIRKRQERGSKWSMD